MANRSALRTRLGVSQNEMAALLGIGRSLYSLWELGRRQLPTAALLQITELEKQLQVSATERTPDKHNYDELLKKLLKENEYQLIAIERKIEKAANKHEAAAHLERLAGSIAKSQMNKNTAITMRHKAGKSVAIQEGLFRLKLEHELLLLEKELLESKLTKEAATREVVI